MSAFKNRRSTSVDNRVSRKESFVPERKRRSSEDRMSRLSGFKNSTRWSGNRKSSIATDVKRKETRALTDKAYQKRKVGELFDFLMEVDFKYPITKEKLLSPSKKDFEKIFEFLYNFFDPKYEVVKIEEEAPKILKNLGYPFTINKSAFTYVARTSYPSLLGVWLWLMDLVKFDLKTDISQVLDVDDDNDERTQMHRIAVQYIYKCYYAREEEQDSIFTDIIKQFMTDDTDALEAKNEEQRQKIAAVNKEIEEIEQLEMQKQLLDDQLKKYEDWSVKMKDHMDRKNEEYKARLAELKQKESELKELQEQVAIKQEAYDAQGFDGKKQLKYFECQKKELVEKLEKKQAQFKDIQDKNWDAQIKISLNSEKLKDVSETFSELYSKIVDEFTSILEPLKTFDNPHIKKLCSSFDSKFSLLQVPLPPSHSDLWKTKQQNVLNTLSEIINNVSDVFRKVTAAQKEKLTELEAKKAEISRQLKLLAAEESLEETDLTSKEKQANEEIKNLESQIEQSRNEIQTFQAELAEKEETYKAMVAELKLLTTFREERTQYLKEGNEFKKETFALCEKIEQEWIEKVEQFRNDILERLRRGFS